MAQKEHRQIFPRPGWVEHDPAVLWHNVRDCVHGALARVGIDRNDLAAIAITNQRETCVVWDRKTGRPIQNAIDWQDVRTERVNKKMAEEGGRDGGSAATGMQNARYYEAEKIAWILEQGECVWSAGEGGRREAGRRERRREE